MATPSTQVLSDYLDEQLDALAEHAQGVRDADPRAVHQSRVATRRTRTTLRVFRRLVDRDQTEPLRVELRWFAGELGQARDAHVIRRRIIESLEEVPADLLRGPVEKRLNEALDAAADAGYRSAATAINSDRFATLEKALADFRGDKPWRSRAQGPAKKVLPPLVDKAFGRVDRAWRAADDADTREEYVEALHQVRRKAKAARYASDALVPVFGKSAERAAGRFEDVTDELGVVEDCRNALARLQDLTEAARNKRESPLTYGVLIGQLLELSSESEKRGLKALKRASAPKARSVTD